MDELRDRLGYIARGQIDIKAARAETANHAQRCFDALEIAAIPEQIVGGPARQIAEYPVNGDVVGGRHSVSIATGLDDSTQTSADCAPSPMLMARASGPAESRQNPPGMTRQPSGVAAA